MSYESHVKDLVMGFTENGTVNLYRGINVAMNLLSYEDRSLIQKQILELYPEKENKQIFTSRKAFEFSLYESILEVDVRQGGNKEIFRFIFDIFQKSTLRVKFIPGFDESLEKLNQFFGLDPVSLKALAYIFIYSNEKQLEELCPEMMWREELIRYHKCISEDRGEVIKAIGLRGTLVTCGLATIVRSTIRVNPVISEFLLGSSEEGFEDQIVAPPPADVLPLSFFDLPEEKLSYLKKLLLHSSSLNVLFTGKPGTGKTSLGYALLKELGIPCISLKHDLENTENRKVSLYVARRLAQKTGKVLVVDEADDLIENNESMFFRSNDTGKAAINLFLDGCQDVRIIWITNKNRICESTARRFNYVMNFKELTQSQRLQIWKNTAEKHEQNWVLDLPELPKLVQKYPLDAGSISDCLKRAEEIGEKNVSFLTHYLDQKLEFLKGEKSQADNTLSNYSVDALNLSVSPEMIIQHLKKFKSRKDLDHAYNLLLHGVSGSGKTEFVKFLGNNLDCKVIVKSVSDLVSKYVGETEARIAESFREAKAAGAILFYDEADSFFQNRENAHRQYERDQVNELLIQMNNFHGGIFIAGTNFMSFDPASMRRFQLKVKFGYLNEDGKRILFNRYFPQFDFPPELLSVRNTTPGDFRNVAQRLGYEESFEVGDILREFREEVSYKSEMIKVGLV